MLPGYIYFNPWVENSYCLKGGAETRATLAETKSHSGQRHLLATGGDGSPPKGGSFSDYARPNGPR
jgi:hypothetical protein